MTVIFKKFVIILWLGGICLFSSANMAYLDITLSSNSGVSVAAELPETFMAYEYIEIPYVINGAFTDPIAIQATAYECIDKLAGRSLFDCTLPGDLSANVYLIRIAGSDFSEQKVNNQIYPPIDTVNYGIQSIIHKKYMTHFTFIIENAGDTIWSSEGYGQLSITLQARDDSGNLYPEETQTYPMEYIYPGEFFEVTLPIWTHRLPYGNFTIELEMIYRGQESSQRYGVLASGLVTTRATFPITLAQLPPEEPVATVVTVENFADQRAHYIDSEHKAHDEFMTSYRIHATEDTNFGTLKLMVAPWTEVVTLKLITPDEIITETISVEIDDSRMDLTFNPDNPWIVDDAGKPLPALMPKSMPCIRESYYTSINADQNITGWLEKAYDIGARTMGMMSYNWALWMFRDKTYDATNRSTFYWGPSLEYYYKELRRLGMKVLWWGSYEFQWQAYDEVAAMNLADNRYSVWISRSDPDLITAIGCYIDWAIDHYGDIMYRTADGRLPIVFDFGNGMAWHGVGRRWLGPTTQKEFIEKMKEKYETIENLNAAWNWNFGSFNEMDPEPSEPDQRRMFYNETTAPFVPGTTVMQDLDDFRANAWADFMIAIRAELQKRHPEIIVGFLDESHQHFGIEGDPEGSLIEQILYEFNRVHAVQPSVLAARRPVDFLGNYVPYAYDRFDLLEQAVHNKANWGIDSFYQPASSTGQIYPDPQGPYGWHSLVATGEPFRITGYNVKRALVPQYPHLKIHYENGSPCPVGWTDFHAQRITETQIKEYAFFIDKASEMLASVPQSLIEAANPKVSAYEFEQAAHAEQSQPVLQMWLHGGSFTKNGKVELKVALTNYSQTSLNDVQLNITVPPGWNIKLIDASEMHSIKSGQRGVARYQLHAFSAMRENRSFSGETLSVNASAQADGVVVAETDINRPLYWQIVCGSEYMSDINCDGVVDIEDLLLFIEDWLKP